MTSSVGASNENVKWRPENDHVVTGGEKFWKKAKEDPFIPIGFVGLAGALMYGVYSYKNRGPMSTSRYLMRLRVIAQSMVVGAIILGIATSGSLTGGSNHLDEKKR